MAILNISWSLAILLFSCIALVVTSHTVPPKFFNVVRYGAIGDGTTDNAQAFVKAWKDACAYKGRSRVWIPNGRFLLSPVSFEGSCNGSMAFLLKGTLVAPTDLSSFTDMWIAFRYLSALTVRGGGSLDGQGHSAWHLNDCKSNPHCKPLPVTLRFDFVRNSRVENIQSINSKSSHFNVFSCENLTISHVRLSAPADSPNTDGIHIGSSRTITIANSIIGTGDDCVSMVSGSQNIKVNNVVCGPGHGISIGSLGRGHEREYVEDITVANCTFIASENGVRIKTWSPSSYSMASGLVFENIIMKNSKNPVLIDQYYCPSPHCYIKGKSSSDVQIQDVTFKNIRGVSSTEVALNLQCSEAMPCKNVKLIDIDLAYEGPGRRATALCSHVIGSSYGKLVPGGCV
ncbi:exopolygalacturonase-like [Salvia hispanica]|uniref:exopolygalacturonase-like n=1 Tax=Salvia hispanica TaxID=49212 RepID=UPI0020094B60|nr:exopolygalacturonase-like [Salvia hispanica]